MFILVADCHRVIFSLCASPALRLRPWNPAALPGGPLPANCVVSHSEGGHLLSPSPRLSHVVVSARHVCRGRWTPAGLTG